MWRTWGIGLLCGLAAIGCSKPRRAEPAPAPPQTRDAAVSGDAGLKENRLPSGVSMNVVTDAGMPPPARGYRITGSLSVQPDTAAPNYQLREQRLDMLQARCSKVGDKTLCVSGSLH